MQALKQNHGLSDGSCSRIVIAAPTARDRLFRHANTAQTARAFQIVLYCSAMAFSTAFCRSVTEMVHSAFRSASVPSAESLPISTAFLPFR